MKANVIKSNKKSLYLFTVILLTVFIASALVVLSPIKSHVAYAVGLTSQPPYAVNTTSYYLDDNTGYNIKSNSSKSNPLSVSSLASVYIDVNTTTGSVQGLGTKTVNGKSVNQYGVEVGNGEVTDSALVDVKLKFNKTFSYQTSGEHAGETKIVGTSAGDAGWFLSKDSAQSVAEYNNIGVINSGALILAKSYDGVNWTWQRDGYVDEYKNNFHTTDFITGESTSGYGFADAYGTDKFPIYTPSGKDISRGVYIKILLAYEIKYATYSYHQGGFLWLERIKDTTWHYKNILEESIFYLASNSATVAFTNASDDNPASGENSELVRQAGTILDGHGTLKGFRLNKLNNASFTIKYRLVKPNTTPTGVWTDAYDGQFFSEKGRYDFEITTSFGEKYKNPDTKVEYYSVFVNNLDINGAVNLYFGNPNNLGESNFITSASTRIFSMEDDIPVYVAGQTYYKVNAVSPAYMPVAGKIYKDGDRNNPVKTFVGSYAQATGTITEPGYYEAEFYSNKDYAGTMSGDAYHFIFRFKVIAAADAPEPIINQQILNSIITASDLQGSYYSVAVPTLGTGKAIFAFGNYSAAYGFAYEYERGKVVATQGGYTYRGQNYTSQFDVLDKVDEFANSLVVKRYLDASDLNSYLTISDVVDDVTQISISKDIIVFSDDTVQQTMKSGEPFFNDRTVRTLNSNGTITETTVPFKFIQVANFESNSVVLTHVDTNKPYTISYDVGVEQQLQAVNAPSGRYKITETTKGGVKTEYYAIYIKTGDIAANIEIDKFYNGELTTKKYTSQDNNLPTTVNGFQIKGASNAHDGQTIVKVEKNSSQIFIGTIDDVAGQVFTAEGNYTVMLVDRLGNSYKLYFNIYIEAASSTITFNNDGVTETKTVFDGQTISLQTLSKAGFIFKGWSDGTARYNGTYTINGSADRTLTAIWHYPSVAISLYDGALYNTFTNNVEDIRTLPFLTKAGYEFQGWFASFGDGTGRFYYGQISSVPNVASFRLDAIWKKTTTGELNPQTGTGGQSKITLVNGSVIQTITAGYGSTVTLPNATQEGMIFFGWQYQISGSNGIIYTAGKIESVPNASQIILHALFKADPNYIAPAGTSGQSGNGAGAGTTTGDSSGSVGGDAGNDLLSNLLNKDVLTGISSVLFVLAALMILLGFVNSKKKQGLLNRVAFANAGSAPQQVSVKEKPVKTYTENQDEQARAQKRQLALYRKAERKAKFERILEDVELAPRRGWWKIAVPVICCAMVFVMCGHFLMQQFTPVVAYHRQEQAIQAQIDRQLEEYDNALAAYTEQNANADFKYNLSLPNGQSFGTYLNEATSNFEAATSNAVGFDSFEIKMSEEDKFLYSLVLVDYLSIGYTVFPAIAIKPNGEEVIGIAYTTYEQFIEGEADDDFYVAIGFIAFQNQANITRSDVDIGVVVNSINVDDSINYLVAFSETFGDLHYVAYGKYVTYGTDDYSVCFTSTTNDPANYDISLGAVYDYDLGRFVYDPNLGNVADLSALGINSNIDYDTAKESFRAYIEQQNQNGLEVNTLNSIYISLAAYNEMLLNGQDESFLGLSPEDIYEFESQLTHKEFYYVTADGQLHKAEFPPPPPGKPGFWSRFAVFAAAIGSIAIGIIILVVTTPCGGPANPLAQMAAGAFFGAGFELFSQGLAGKGIEDVNWLKVGVAAVSGALSALPIGGAMGYVVAGLIGGATDVAMKALDGGINSWQDAFTTFAVGALKAVAIRALTQVASKVASKLGCFVAGTAVATLTGISAIEALRIGDKVATQNATTGLVEYQPVSHIFVYNADRLTHITLDNGEVITATPNHPIYVQNMGYVSAENLRAGDILVTVNGKAVIVEQIQHELLENPIFVYNLEVGNNHNYFVGTNNSDFNENFVLVHNVCKYKANYIKEHGSVPDGFDVHHQLPQKWRADFGKLGIDVDNVKYLQAVEHTVHNANSYAYNQAWAKELAKAGEKGSITKEVVEGIWEGLKGFFS